MAKNSKEIELLEHLLSQAWALSDEEIDSLKPGNINKAIQLIDRPEYNINCLSNLTKEELENPDIHLLDIMRNPKFFHFTCKHLFKLDNGRPLELMPMQSVVLEKLWSHQFPMLIASRGFSKTFSLALYSLLRLTFCPGSKVVIVAGGFRQAKLVLEYMERLWYSSNVFRDLVSGGGGLFGRENGPYHGIDRWDFVIGNSIATALPLGDGKKIRGLRANYIVTDEFACLDANTLVETDKGLIRIADCEHVIEHIKLLQRDGTYIKPERFFKTPITKAYEITCLSGYSFICSSIHKVYTQNGWKLAKDLTVSDKLVLENNYVFPKHDLIDLDVAWLIGKICAAGVIVKDECKIFADNAVERVFLEDAITKLTGEKNRGKNSVASIKMEFVERLGIDLNNKKVPQLILQSSEKVLAKFLKGIFGTKHAANFNGNDISFTKQGKDDLLFKDLQVLLFKLNIQTFINQNRLIVKRQCCTAFSNFIAGKAYHLPNTVILDVKKIEELPEEQHLYDFYVPGTNTFYGNSFVQHNSVPEDVYSTVVAGFGSVTADPVQNVKDMARQRVLKRLGMWSEDMEEEEAGRSRGNQSILSGTAYYSFNHFAKYWREYKEIINSRGDPKRLEEIFRGPPPAGFNYRDYCVVRIPVKMLRAGFMDDKTIARAQQTTHSGIFNMEFNCIFTSDSEGFFKRSLIEKCVVGKEDNPSPPTFPSCGVATFSAQLKGHSDKKYVYGIDPASENDSFAITIIELWPDHRRIVYCWTTKKSDHREKLKVKLTEEHDFYKYCIRKIRNLFKAFPPELLMVDSGGGGLSLREAFGDPDKLEPGELPVHEVIDPNNPKDTDEIPGMKILKMCHFRNNAWLSESNHGLKKDFEDMILLFPRLNTAEIGADLAIRESDEENPTSLYDTLEDCAMEIELMKDEISSIVVTETNKGLEQWDVPDKKMAGSKKGPMRKDRYSSLLMANAGARAISKIIIPEYEYNGVAGGFSSSFKSKTNVDGKMYNAPAWFQKYQKNANSYGAVVKK